MEALVARSPSFGGLIGSRLSAAEGTVKSHLFLPPLMQTQNLSGVQRLSPLTNSLFVSSPCQLATFKSKAYAAEQQRLEHRTGVTAFMKAPTCEPADCEMAPPLLRRILDGMLNPYVKHNPSADKVMAILRKRENGGPLHFDHFAFRTFGVEGYGISSIAKMFLDLGYTQRDELRFPAKKLRAYWYAPPKEAAMLGSEDMTNGPLPRIFISELLVEQLSEKSQAIIKKYTSAGRHLAGHAVASSLVHGLPWPDPELKDYVDLARESEYAAWTLVNGYALNHTTITVHDFKASSGLGDTVDHLMQSGIKMNGAGGNLLNVSPDGMLLQASTEADVAKVTFADGQEANVARSYIELAERLVLPHFRDLPLDKIHECHRRDGFEVGNADNIFESTSIKR